MVWLGSSLEDLRAFPAAVRRLAGYPLRRVQGGLMLSDWKSMPSVGPGAHEIRLRTGREHRVFYVARFGEAVYVLHAFEKNTRRTHRADLDLARRRDSELRVVRAQAKEIEMAPRMRHSSGNVFRDLGFSTDEAEHLKVRADLMIRLTRLIETKGLTQARAARLFGVSQPRISDLVRGKIARFSVDSLIEMLGHAGARVSVVVRRRRRVA